MGCLHYSVGYIPATVSNQFWNALDKDMQDKFNQASLYAASLERSWSVNEANEFAANTEEQNKLGVNYSELNDDDVEKTDNDVNLVIPNMSPLQAISWLSTKAYNTQNKKSKAKRKRALL